MSEVEASKGDGSDGAMRLPLLLLLRRESMFELLCQSFDDERPHHDMAVSTRTMVLLRCDCSSRLPAPTIMSARRSGST